MAKFEINSLIQVGDIIERLKDGFKYKIISIDHKQKIVFLDFFGYPYISYFTDIERYFKENLFINLRKEVREKITILKSLK